MRVTPVSGTDADRLFAEELGKIKPNEIHTTDQKRVFMAGQIIAPVYHGSVSSEAGLLLLNDLSERGCFEGDTAYVEETNSIWVCVANRGENLGSNDVDWINLNKYPAIGPITDSKFTVTEGRLLGRFTEDSDGIGPVEEITVAGGLTLSEDGVLAPVGPIINSSFTVSDQVLLGRSTETSQGEGLIEEIKLGSNLILEDGILNAKDSVLISDEYDKGDILAGNATGDLEVFSLGTDGYVLTADSTEPLGVKWVAAGSDITKASAWNSKGDQIVATGNDAAAVIGIGSTGQIWRVVSGTAAWSNEVTLATDTLWAAKGDLVIGSGNDTAGILSKSTDGYILALDSAQTLGVKWVPSPGAYDITTATTWNAAGDQLVATGNDSAAIVSIGSTGQAWIVASGTAKWGSVGVAGGGTGLTSIVSGGLFYGSAANVVSVLGPSTDGYVLSLTSGLPTWVPPVSGTGYITGPLVGAQTKTFTYSSDGDANGVMYFMGTDFGNSTWTNPTAGGRVLALRITDFSLTANDLTNRAGSEYNASGNGSTTPWAAWDLGAAQKLNVVSYSIQNYNQPNRYMRNWKLQGTNAVTAWNVAGFASSSWTDLDTRTSDTTQNSANAWATKTCNQGVTTKYRYIRLLMTGPESLGDYYMCCQEIELYGVLDYTPAALVDGSPVVWDGLSGTKVKQGISYAISNDAVWVAKGDFLVGKSAKSSAILSVGANGLVPQADSSQTVGVKWAPARKYLCTFGPENNQPPAANYALFLQRNSIAVLSFADAATTSAIFLGIMPFEANFTTGLTVIIDWMSGTATSGNCVWSVSFEQMSTDEDTDSFATAVTATTAASVVSGIVIRTSINFTGSQIDGIVATNLFRVRVQRLGADGSDSMTGTAQLLYVTIAQQ